MVCDGWSRWGSLPGRQRIDRPAGICAADRAFDRPSHYLGGKFGTRPS